MKIYILLIFSSFLFSEGILSQDTTNASYFRYLKDYLSKDSTVKEIKFYEKRHKNGKIACQMMYVKIKNDAVNRFWSVGKHYCYSQNGVLLGYGNIDLRTKTYRDTSFYYDENAQLIEMDIYNNKSKHSIPSESLSRKYCVCYPDSFITIRFKGVKKKLENVYKYYEDLKDIELFSEITYNDDGTIAKKSEHDHMKKEED